MQKRYTRKLSFNERVFVVADRLYPPLANQFIFEGTGAFDVEKWRDAVETASAANPGSRAVLKGILNTCRWVDSGVTPPVIEEEEGGWEWDKPETVPCFAKPLPPEGGPACEVVLAKGEPLRAIFRTHHALMDGMGTFVWVNDIFRALRGEPCNGSHATITDTELARSFQKEMRKPYPTEHIAPTGTAEGSDSGMITRRIRVRGRFHNLMGQIALQIAREAWSHSDGVVRLGIPVDMRPRMNGLVSTANLTYAIYIEIRNNSTAESITEDIAGQLRDKREGMLSRGDDMARYVPMWLLGRLARKIIEDRHQRSIYSLSGLISNVGRIKLQNYRGGGFEPTAFWGIPPVNDYVPFFIGIGGYDDVVELVLSLPRRLATRDRIDGLLERIIASLH